MPGAKFPDQIPRIAAKHRTNSQAALPGDGGGSGKKAATMPWLSYGKKWQVGLDQISPTGGPNLRDDG